MEGLAHAFGCGCGFSVGGHLGRAFSLGVVCSVFHSLLVFS